MSAGFRCPTAEIISSTFLSCSPPLKDIKDVCSTPTGLLIAVNDEFGNPRILNVSVADRDASAAQVLAGDLSVSVTRGNAASNDDTIYFADGDPVNTPLVGATCVYYHRPTGAIYFCSPTRIGRIEGSGTLSIIAGVIPSREAAVIYGGPANGTTFSKLAGIRSGSGPDELLVTDAGAQTVYRLNLTSNTIVAVAGMLISRAFLMRSHASPCVAPSAGQVQFEALTPSLNSTLLATSISLPGPYDVTVNSTTRDIYASLSSGDVVVRVSATTASMSVIAGTGVSQCGGDGIATETPMIHPTSVSLDGRGGLLIADRRCCLLRKLDLSSNFMTVLAGKLFYSTALRIRSVYLFLLLSHLCCAGNTTSHCNSSYVDSYPSSASTQVELSDSVHELFYVVADKATGDVYWTEDLSCRILVLRRDDGKVYRIAGSGSSSRGKEEGCVSAGASALGTALVGPTSIALDPDGDVVFIDGNAPGRILRISRTSGSLEPIWQPSRPRNFATVSLSNTPLHNGACPGSAGAWSLHGIAYQFNDDQFMLLVADKTPAGSILRRINNESNNVSLYMGSLSGNASDGVPLLQAGFSSIVAVAVLPGGSIALADAGTNTLRIGMPADATLAICPAGFVCTCGTPIPCKDAAYFSPAGELKALSVASGFYAVAYPVKEGSAVSGLYHDQQACEPGSYCAGGIQHLCPAGSYCNESLATGPLDCASCPAGTFNANTGAKDFNACLPCPNGTYATASRSSLCTMCPANHSSSVVGATSIDQCQVCPGNFVALRGASACADLGHASFFSSDTTVTIVGVVP